MKSPRQLESLSPTQKPGASTLAVHAGEDRHKLGDSITDPIVCTATYTFADTQAVIDFIEKKQPREEYGRYGNPGEKVVERKLAAWKAANWRCSIPAEWPPSSDY